MGFVLFVIVLKEDKFKIEKNILIKKEIEVKKINVFKFMEKYFKIFLDINGYLNMFGCFDEVFIEFVFNFCNIIFIFYDVSLEIINMFK